ncbi:MAG: GntR family transcriptional regulator [Burkholderiaceae bacterium]
MTYSLKVSSAPTLREQVVARLREAIARGHFAPGQRLRERVLCEMTGVSRTSLREALRELESEGLIMSVPNRGIMVSPIDLELARSTFELRGSLEALAVDLFVQRAGEREVAALARAFEAMQQAYRSGDSAAIIASKSAFYDAILDGAANPLLRPILKSIHVRVSQLRSASLNRPSRPAESLREFAALSDAMQRRDAAAANEACRVHVANAAEAALAGLAEQARRTSRETSLTDEAVPTTID